MLGIFGTALLLAGCNDGRLPGAWSSSTGGISPVVSVDASVKSSSRALDYPSDVQVSDLGLRLISDDGFTDRSWASVSEFDPETEFPIGEYSVEAFRGDLEIEGFSAPYFYGSGRVTIIEKQSTPVNVTARLANSMVSINYTEAFKKYMSDWDALVTTSSSKPPMTYERDETRPMYVKPGTVSIVVHVVKPSGVSATLQADSFTAKARTHHKITIDVNNGEAGEAVLSIIYDETVDQEVIEIPLDDEILSAPEPTITASGFTPGVPLSVIECADPDEPTHFDIVARGGIASAVLTTSSPSLIQQGWPAQVDLVGLDSATKDKLMSMGLNCLGIWKNPDKMAVIDLTGVFAFMHITATGTTANSFTLQVTDRITQKSEPLTFDINLEPLLLELVSGTPFKFHATSVTLDVKFNGDGLANKIKFEVQNERGTWDPVEISGVRSNGPEAYKVTIKMPPADRSLTFRAQCIHGTMSNTLEVPVIEPNVTLSATPEDTYATHAYVTAEGDISDDMRFEYSADGGATYNVANAAPRAAQSRATAKEFHLTGLPHNSELLVRVLDDSHESRAVAITTEEIKQFDDAGFDEWSHVDMSDGGYQYLWTIESHGVWATNNELTTSNSGTSGTTNYAYKATSATIPANGRSTQSSANDGSLGTGRHADGHTAGNPALHNDRAANGANAALIRTVAWGSGNSATANVFSPSDNAGFGTLNHTTPGELFLGTYNNGSKDGIEWSSRPTAINFNYAYVTVSAGNGDYGRVEYTLWDAADNEIANGGMNINETQTRNSAADYVPVYHQGSIAINYTAKGKAAKMRLVFISSANENALNHSKTYWTTPGHQNRSGGEYIGSELYIDDVELIY